MGDGMSSMPGFAVNTRVPIVQTRTEIEALCSKHGAVSYASFSDAKGSTIAFGIHEMRVVFRLPLPNPDNAQDCRSRWRGLLLCIKAKFESINRGVETFEEAFLAHVMTEDGRTVADHAIPRLKQIVSGDRPLLPVPNGGGQ